MVVVYRTSNRHHLAMDKVKKSQCGRPLSTMDVVRLMPEGITESHYRELHRLRPFCKVCIGTSNWKELNWRLT